MAIPLRLWRGLIARLLVNKVKQMCASWRKYGLARVFVEEKNKAAQYVLGFWTRLWLRISLRVVRDSYSRSVGGEQWSEPVKRRCSHTTCGVIGIV